MINKKIPNPNDFSSRCKIIIKKKARVSINLANDTIKCCRFLFLNWKTEKIDKPADKNIHNLGYEKLSLKKYSAVSSYKTGKL